MSNEIIESGTNYIEFDVMKIYKSHLKCFNSFFELANYYLRPEEDKINLYQKNESGTKDLLGSLIPGGCMFAQSFTFSLNESRSLFIEFQPNLSRLTIASPDRSTELIITYAHQTKRTSIILTTKAMSIEVETAEGSLKISRCQGRRRKLFAYNRRSKFAIRKEEDYRDEYNYTYKEVTLQRNKDDIFVLLEKGGSSLQFEMVPIEDVVPPLTPYEINHGEFTPAGASSLITNELLVANSLKEFLSEQLADFEEYQFGLAEYCCDNLLYIGDIMRYEQNKLFTTPDILGQTKISDNEIYIPSDDEVIFWDQRKKHNDAVAKVLISKKSPMRLTKELEKVNDNTPLWLLERLYGNTALPGVNQLKKLVAKN